MEATEIHMPQHLLASSDTINSISTSDDTGTIGIIYGGGGEGPARARELDDLGL